MHHNSYSGYQTKYTHIFSLSSATWPSNQLIYNMDRFITSLKKKYRERLLHRQKQWPPVSIEKYVNLQLVEAEKNKGFRAGLPQHGARDDKVKHTPILHGDLFNVEAGKKPVRKLIVEGNAGMGKTTLCTMLAEEWAEDKIFTQFDCVLLLPLRERSVSTATTLPQLFKLLHSSERIRTTVVEELEDSEGESALIIADGWDELDVSNSSSDSFLYNLLFGDVLPFVSVLLTSRPSASAPLHDIPSVNRLVEVMGFNEENVKQYIEMEFEKYPEKASSLIKQLEKNPVIQSVCSVPLNCAILCNLWHTLGRVLPSTLTELYTQIILNIILRDFKKRSTSGRPISLSFDSISEDRKSNFWLTCEFAYQCLSQDQIVFSEEELASSFPEILASSSLEDLDSNDKFLCFGLLQCARSLLSVGQGLSFHFVHLTIQEFLAALHLVTLPNEEKLKVCEAHAKSNRFAMVWRFVFGLGFKRVGSCSRKVICLDDEVVDRMLAHSHNSLLICHLAFESRNNDFSIKAAEQINGSLVFSSISPYDREAVFNILHHTSVCSNLMLGLAGCDLRDKQLKELTRILSSLSSTGDNLQIKKLVLYSNKLTENGVTDLFNRGSASFSSLESLHLNGNSITDIKLLFSLCNSLEVLSLSDNPFGVSGIQSLEAAVQAGGLVNLEMLHLSNTLTDDADINGALLTTLLPSIASHCPRLNDLDLSKNNLDVSGVCAVGEVFSLLVTTRIEHEFDFVFNLSDTNISYEAMKYLDLLTNEPIATEYSIKLYEFSLNLSDNSFGYGGLMKIFSMLRKEACPVTELRLENIKFTNPGTETLFYDIQYSNLGPVVEASKITSLVMPQNNFSGDQVLLLAECIRVFKSLEEFGCWECSLTSNDIKSFLDHLKAHESSNNNLKEWDLSYNSIDDEGVSALIVSLPELFPSLEVVFVNDNPVSDEIAEELTECLEANRKELDAYELAEFERLAAQEKDEEEARISAVLTEWEKTWSPPQNEEILEDFNEMWEELLNEMVDEFELAIENEVGSASQKVTSPTRRSSSEDLTTEDSPMETKLEDPLSSDEMADVTTPPQTTPFSHSTPSGVCGLKTMTIEELKGPPLKKPKVLIDQKTVTIEELKVHTKVIDSQLDTEIEEKDMILLAPYFRDVDTLSEQLELNAADQQNAKFAAVLFDIQTGIDKALKLWRKANPGAATYRALVEIVLRMGVNGTAIAEEVCKFLALKWEQGEAKPNTEAGQ